MSEVIYYLAASLDGFIATPDGGVDWLSEFEAAGEDYGYAAFYASIDALLLGRRTYEQTLSFGAWPYAGKPAWVFSRRTLAISQPDVTLAELKPEQQILALEKRGLNRFWLVGGASLAFSFRERGLITEVIVSTMPVILGAGVPLFDPGGPQEHLTLLQSKRYQNGVVQLRYVKQEGR